MISKGKTSVMRRGIPVGKQLATVGSKSTRPLVIFGWPGSSFLLAFHFASAQGRKEGSIFGLKVGPDSVMFAQTPFRSAVWAFFFAPGCPVFFFQAEDGIRDLYVTGVQTCALPI